eukprot:8125537-Heterocapsa_arctica.AAC.1
MFQNDIDQKEDRDRQVAKAEEEIERENKRAIKAVIFDEFHELGRKDIQHEVSQHNKKPRTEEP